jgi:phthalate 4,5-dioxygenase reductase subunit
MCRQGVCGECRTPLARGRADHRDLVLTPGERDDWIMPCVSRAADDDGLELRL